MKILEQREGETGPSGDVSLGGCPDFPLRENMWSEVGRSKDNRERWRWGVCEENVRLLLWKRVFSVCGPCLLTFWLQKQILNLICKHDTASWAGGTWLAPLPLAIMRPPGAAPTDCWWVWTSPKTQDPWGWFSIDYTLLLIIMWIEWLTRSETQK